MSDQLSDMQMVQQFKDGNTDIFQDIMTTNFPFAYKIAFKILRHHQDSEDVVSEAFVSIYKNLNKFREEANFKTWLFRIVSNSAKNRYRWNKRRKIHENNSLDDDTNGLAYTLANTSSQSDTDYCLEILETVKNHLEDIPEVYKNVFLMRIIDNKSYDEIAAITSLSLGTVKSRIFRARNLLRQKLKATDCILN